MNAAATIRERARIDAMMKLRSLGQTYTFEGTLVNNIERPVFPPPAGYLGDEWQKSNEYIQMPGSPSRTHRSGTTGTTYRTGDVDRGRTDVTDDTRTVRGADDTRTVRGSDGRPVGSVDPFDITPPDPTRVLPERPADMGIDSVITRPEVPTVPTTPLPVKPEGPTHPGGNPYIPPTFTNGPVGGPPATLPPATGTAKGLPPLRTGPLGPGGTLPRLPQEHGIVGGRPVPPTTGGRNATGLPRSTVIGGEQPYGRGGTGGVPGPHAGGGTGPGNGPAAGRRLASEQGGVVGGRPQPRGQASGRPFTPGGTGLVRGGQGQPGAGTGPVVGRPAAGGTGAAGTGADERDERRTRRPDYLVEDEETWQQQNKKRPIVPPVVD
ncbi:hypothetical protein RGF97_20890 [Streptomyces roseicoloratus]|uniref:Uncharacterized protein n=1 Tax=Streptomyces roseicoloratus TaxID=2508722 RepID=A0ABY9RX98_9ACTN|nr:hypothetical protein [Streptomyces roseicoloratus]WMX46788.1 hypothetical protein RGF97_20890 [Streptomyces roseicoloratus]